MTHTLIDRIEHGVTTVDDASIVSSIIARMAAYDAALREICAYGTGDAAMLACRVLAGETHEPARQA